MIETVRESRDMNGYAWMERGEDHDMAPYFAWFAYRDYLDARRGSGASERPELYVSLAITSGGYKRDSTLGIGEVVAKNTDYGAALREFFASQGLAHDEIVIPSELGAMRQASWGQLDFLMLWFHIMSGVSIDQAVNVERELMGWNGGERVYGPGKWEQNDKLNGLSSEQAWQIYEQFTARYVNALSQCGGYSPDTQAVKGIVGVLDNDLSLGGRAEKLWGDIMDVPYYELEVQAGHAPEQLVGHVEALEALGAKAVHLSATAGPSLIFRSSEATNRP